MAPPAVVPSLAGADLSAFEKFIADKSYVADGVAPTEVDFAALAQLNGRVPDMRAFPCAYRWATHVAEVQRRFPRAQVPGAAGAGGSVAACGAAESSPGPRPPATLILAPCVKDASFDNK